MTWPGKLSAPSEFGAVWASTMVTRLIEEQPQADAADVQLDKREAREWQAARTFQRMAHLQWLLTETVTRPNDLTSILTAMLDISLEEGHLAESGTVFLVTRQVSPRTAAFLIKRGWHSGERQHFQFDQPLQFDHFEEDEGILGAVLQTGATIWSNEAASHPQYRAFNNAPQLNSIACVPIKYAGHLLAVVSIHNRTRHLQFDTEDIGFVEALAAVAAVAIWAGHNRLTLLPNKELMLELVSLEMEKCARLARPLSIAYLDLDRFGRLDNKVGHGNADQAIRRVGEFLKNQTPKGVIVCHPHGDEFVLVCPTYGGDEAKQTIKTLLDDLSGQTFEIPSRSGMTKFLPSASAGLATAAAGMTPEELVDFADEVHRIAKKKNRGGVLTSAEAGY